jgi:hypothetical protein
VANIAFTISSGVSFGERRPPRALLQARRPVAQIAVDPLVAGLAGDAVQRAQLRDRQRVAKEVGDELRSLVHG